MECANVLSGVPQENSVLAAASTKNPFSYTIQEGKQGFSSLLDLFTCLLGAEGQNLEERKGSENGLADTLESNLQNILQNILQNMLTTGDNSGLAGLLLNLQGSFPTGMDADLLRFAEENFVGFNKSKPVASEFSGKISPQTWGWDASNEMDLDKYKLLIARLLDELSGKITKLPVHNSAVNDPNFIHNLQKYYIAKNAIEPNGTAPDAELAANNLPVKTDGAHQVKSSPSENNSKASVQVNIAKQENSQGMKNDHMGAVQTEKRPLPKTLENNNILTQYNQAVFKASELSQNNTPKIDFQNIITQISKEFKSNIPVDSKEIKEFEVQLHPAELGKIKINLRLQDGQVHLNLRASEPMTQANLQQNLSQLREQLEATGVSCGSLEMDLGRGGNSHWEQTRQTNAKNHFAEKKPLIDMDMDKTFTATDRHYDGGTRINFMA